MSRFVNRRTFLLALSTSVAGCGSPSAYQRKLIRAKDIPSGRTVTQLVRQRESGRTLRISGTNQGSPSTITLFCELTILSTYSGSTPFRTESTYKTPVTPIFGTLDEDDPVAGFLLNLLVTPTSLIGFLFGSPMVRYDHEIGEEFEKAHVYERSNTTTVTDARIRLGEGRELRSNRRGEITFRASDKAKTNGLPITLVDTGDKYRLYFVEIHASWWPLYSTTSKVVTIAGLSRKVYVYFKYGRMTPQSFVIGVLFDFTASYLVDTLIEKLAVRCRDCRNEWVLDRAVHPEHEVRCAACGATDKVHAEFRVSET